MKKRTLSIFIMYVWTKMLVELVRNPYIAVRNIHRNRFLLPVIISPFITLFLFLLTGKTASLIFESYGIERSIIASILSIISITIILWQLLLLYLFVNFLLLLRRK